MSNKFSPTSQLALVIDKLQRSNQYEHVQALTEIHEALKLKTSKLNSTPEGMISLTLSQGHIVHGTDEAITFLQHRLLIDSTHPVEAKDNARYFASLAQHRWEKLSQLTNTLARTRTAMRELLARLENL